MKRVINKQYLICVLLVLFVHCDAQQKQVSYANQYWSNYQPQFRFSKHWGIWVDMEIHSKDNEISQVSQNIYRLTATYYITDRFKLSAGYGYTNYYPGDNHKYISEPEHHGLQQLQLYTYFRKKKLMQWIRLEEKFKRNVINDSTLANDYTFNYRVRYNCYYTLPLNKKGIIPHSLSLVLADEIYFNFGESIVNNHFDQNRVFGGLSYAVNEHDNLVLGYMNAYQKQASGYQYKSYNIVRLSFYETIDLRKKKRSPNES